MSGPEFVSTLTVAGKAVPWRPELVQRSVPILGGHDPAIAQAGNITTAVGNSGVAYSTYSYMDDSLGAGAFVEYEVGTLEPGLWELLGLFYTGPDRGKVTVTLTGLALGTLDLYATAGGTTWWRSAQVRVPALPRPGAPADRLRLAHAGRNPSATGGNVSHGRLGLDWVAA